MLKNIFLPLMMIVLAAFLFAGCGESEFNYELKTEADYLNIEDVSFNLSDELKDYMDENDLNELALIKVQCRSWIGTYTEVSVHFLNKIKDKDAESFPVYEAEGFKIYVQPGIQAEKEIVTIGLNKDSSRNRLTIDGINLYP